MKKTGSNSKAGRNGSLSRPAVRSATTRQAAPTRPGSSSYPARSSNAPTHTGSRSSSASRRTRKTTKKKSNKGGVIAIVVASLLVLGAGGVYLAYSMGLFETKYDLSLADGTVVSMTEEEIRSSVGGDVFPEGIIINGISVAGMTKDEARSVVLANQPEAPLTVDISLDLAGEIIPVDLSSLTLESNLDEVIDNAYAYSRPTGGEDVDTLIAIFNSRQALKLTPVEFNTAYTLNSEGINQIVRGILEPRASEAVDAVITGFNVETLLFEYTESSRGFDIDIDKACADVKAMLDGGTYVGTVPVDAQVTEPSLSSETIRSEFGLISSASSTTTSVEARNHNITITCEKLNGMVFQPGDIFSFNGIIGQRTYEAGYREAGVIVNGQTDTGLGGGICQVSSMLYQAAIKGNFHIVERNWHMWPSSYCAAGTDASVDWPSQDFSFENDSGYPMAINAYWDPATSKITINFYGHLLPDGETIDFVGEVISRTGYGATEYVPDPSLPVGAREQERGGHDGVVAAAYQIWYDADGNEIDRVQLDNTVYAAIRPRVRVGVLNPDGTTATLDTSTGEVIGAETSETSETSDTSDPSATDSSADTSATADTTPDTSETPPPDNTSDTTPSEPSADTTPAESSETPPPADTSEAPPPEQQAE